MSSVSLFMFFQLYGPVGHYFSLMHKYVSQSYTWNICKYHKLSFYVGNVRIGAVVNLVFSSWKFASHCSVHTKGTSFLVNLVNGAAILKNPLTNLLYYPAKPRKLLISVTVFGLSQLTTASIFAGSTIKPSLKIMCPIKDTYSSQNSHLFSLA